MPEILKRAAKNLLPIVVKICEDGGRDLKELPRGVRGEKHGKADDVAAKSVIAERVVLRAPEVDSRAIAMWLSRVLEQHAIADLEGKHLLQKGRVGLTRFGFVRRYIPLDENADELTELWSWHH
jgi:hypothetical protein